MCGTCGCGSDASHRSAEPPHAHHHGHGDRHHLHDGLDHGDHGHVRAHAAERNGPHGADACAARSEGESARTVRLEAELLAKNDRVAERNRRWMGERGITAINLMGAPGAGKTALLESTLRQLVWEVPAAVIEGDQDTERDAERIRATGCPVVQANTGTGCHLDARMIETSVRQLAPRPGTLLFVENVGNLVCPALFDLGERTKVVVMSVTEGDDKPIKYPHMFRAADALVLNKTDLLPHVDFDLQSCLAWARRVNPELKIFLLSSRRGDGLDDWCGFLKGTSIRDT